MNVSKWSWKLCPCAILPGCLAAALVFGPTLAADAQDWENDVDFIQHSTFQAVDSEGSSAYPPAAFPVKLRGVVLNNTEDWLNPAENYNTTTWNLGGEAEFYMQAVDMPGDSWDDGDFGGTACWMGQNYGNLPWIGDPENNNYQNSDYEGEWPPKWYGQLDDLRLYRPETPFGDADLVRAGDLVEVRARVGLNYKGKMNVNEQHHNTSTYDFEVLILQKGYGLPDPTGVALSEIVDLVGDESVPIFDHTRETGGEHYQSTLVRLENVKLTEAIGWGTNSKLTLVDPTDREFSIHLCRHGSFDTDPAPEGHYFDVVGILDQKLDSGKDAYRLLAMNVDDFLSGDLNHDGFVGQDDLNIVLANWGDSVEQGVMVQGDPSDDGFVGQDDLNLVLANWGKGAPPPGGVAMAAVPEPTTLTILLAGALTLAGLAIVRLRTCVLAMVLVVLTAGNASADVQLSFVPVDDPNVPAGYVTQDLIVNTSTDWLGSQLLITFSEGSVHQHAYGSDVPPLSVLFDDYPQLQFDSYLAAGENAFGSNPSLAGGAVDLGGNPEEQFDAAGINVAWFTTNDDDTGQLFLARITLSENTQGTWKALAGVDLGTGGATLHCQGPVIDGALVPEPGTLLMLAFGGLLLLFRLAVRRRNAR